MPKQRHPPWRHDPTTTASGKTGAVQGLHGVWLAPGQQPPEIPRGFHVLPRRWVVERSLAWFGRNRRLAKDYERLPRTGEMLLYAAMARLTLRRLARRTH